VIASGIDLAPNAIQRSRKRMQPTNAASKDSKSGVRGSALCLSTRAAVAAATAAVIALPAVGARATLAPPSACAVGGAELSSRRAREKNMRRPWQQTQLLRWPLRALMAASSASCSPDFALACKEALHCDHCRPDCCEAAANRTQGVAYRCTADDALSKCAGILKVSAWAEDR
jgi:hypothetical protein